VARSSVKSPNLSGTTTTFDDVAAAVERIRPMAGVEIVGFVGEAHVARGREALAAE
jgi:hypothetical protein